MNRRSFRSPPCGRVHWTSTLGARLEILADASSGTRMTVAQPVGSKVIEVLDFHDPAAGKPGPIALQRHNAGLFNEYKDLAIEVNPEVDGLLMTTFLLID